MDTRPVVGISISEAADEHVYFERPIEFQTMGSTKLGRRLAESQHASTFLPRSRTATIRNHKVRNLVLDGSSMFAYKDGRLIAETASLKSTEHPMGELSPALPAPRRLEKHVIVGCNPNWMMYNHWLMQCLPAIDWSLAGSGGVNRSLALPELELDSWQEETLRLLGYASVPRVTIKPRETYQFDIGEYSDFLEARAPFWNSGAALDTLQRLASAVEPYLDWSGSVYVMSWDEHYGRLENWSQIAEFFRKQGFTLIIPDQCEFAEQVEIFRSARMVVGPHCSRMTNIAFCKPGTLIWELFPQHHVNVCNQRIAQSAGLNYWADLFDSARDAEGWSWRVDLAVVAERFRDIDPPAPRPSFWLAGHSLGSHGASGVERVDRLPLDKLLLEFESLGEDCEFGLVQRDAGIEPIGLLKFAGFYIPWERRLAALIAAIDCGFEGLGALDTIHLELEGQPGQRKEFMLRESVYNLLYHTAVHEGEIEVERLRQQQSQILGFLRRKFLADLESGEKIWIWKGRAQTQLGDITKLLQTLQRRGPNVLLWLSYDDEAHPANTTAWLAADLVRGYVARPRGDLATDFVAGPWHAVCRAAYTMFRPSGRSDG